MTVEITAPDISIYPGVFSFRVKQNSLALKKGALWCFETSTAIETRRSIAKDLNIEQHLCKYRIPHEKYCHNDDDDDDINKKTNDSFTFFYSFVMFDVSCQACTE